MKSIQRIAALVIALLTLWSHAGAQLPLNTGYNHPAVAPYPVIPGQQDNYWINIASYPAGSTAIGPSRVIPQGGWAPPLPGPASFPGTTWISGWPTAASSLGTNPSNPAYTIFRKCFCLLPRFKEPRLSFRARADDSLQVWFNTQLNQLLPPSPGNFLAGNTPLSGGTDKGFRVGKNCLYALVEDTGGAMGFNMEGLVTAAYGLLPIPAAGAAQTFEPCACQSGHTGPLGAASHAAVLGRSAQPTVEEDERQVVEAIIKIAEARRLERQRQRQ